MAECVVDEGRLPAQWLIVVVADRGDQQALGNTLSDVTSQSLGGSVLVLAREKDGPIELVDGECCEWSYGLPDSLDVDAYWVTVLRELRGRPGNILCVRAGVRVPQHWDARLLAAGHRMGGAGAVSSLGARHPWLSAFESSRHEPGLDVDAVDQWLNDYASGREWSVPVLSRSAVALLGGQWQDLELPGTDRELLQGLKDAGVWLLATDQVYVDDTACPEQDVAQDVPAAIGNAYEGRHPLTPVRHALSELSARGETPPRLVDCKPVLLHVGHSWGGGLGRWIEDYVAADLEHRHLVLRSIGDLTGFGQTIALYPDARMGRPLRSWTLSEPILSSAVSHFEYAALLREIVTDCGVEALMVSSVIGHSLDVLHTGLPTTYVFHDFFPYCPALYATFDSPCARCGGEELAGCGRSNPLHSFFKFEPDSHWLSLRSAFVQSVAGSEVRAVAPTASVVARYRTLESAFRDKPIDVVGHGLAQSLSAPLLALREVPATGPGERLSIVMLGRLSDEKGGALLAEILATVAGFADVHLLGAGDGGRRFEGIAGVSVVHSYEKEELSEQLGLARADLGLLLSVVPETFSYTLSELWAAGVPVLATRLGAFADRITHGHNGWLVDPTPAAVLKGLQTLHGDRSEVARVRESVMAEQPKSLEAMVAAYPRQPSSQEGVPWRRYNLPRRSFQNPYLSGEAPASSPLHIDHQASYRTVLREFLVYSSSKLGNTPRLPAGVSRGLNRLLRWAINRLG